MHDKRKKRIFHVNMLKEWNMPTTVCLWTEEMNEEGEEEIPLWERNKENGEMKVGKMVGIDRDGAMHISWSYGGEWNCETRKLNWRH